MCAPISELPVDISTMVQISAPNLRRQIAATALSHTELILIEQQKSYKKRNITHEHRDIYCSFDQILFSPFSFFYTSRHPRPSPTAPPPHQNSFFCIISLHRHNIIMKKKHNLCGSHTEFIFIEQKKCNSNKKNKLTVR